MPLRRLLLIGACLLGFVFTACYSATVLDAGGAGGAGGTGGAGGSGPCRSDEKVVSQPVPTEIVCELSNLGAECAAVCDVECADKGFDLGATGFACAKEGEDTAYCRCLCAYCRLR